MRLEVAGPIPARDDSNDSYAAFRLSRSLCRRSRIRLSFDGLLLHTSSIHRRRCQSETIYQRFIPVFSFHQFAELIACPLPNTVDVILGTDAARIALNRYCYGMSIPVDIQTVLTADAVAKELCADDKQGCGPMKFGFVESPFKGKVAQVDADFDRLNNAA